MSIIHLFIDLSPGFAQTVNETDTLGTNQIFRETDTANEQVFDAGDLEFTMMGDGNNSSFWNSDIFKGTRLGIQYEMAYKVEKPDEIMTNRLSYRLEYSRSLFDYLSLHVDTKLFTFLKGDHRIRNEGDAVAIEGRTREAYVQASFYKTSIKAGIQMVVWGESDYAIVTNEITRLDYREPLSLNMDDLRIGQPTLTVDQYTSFGHWNAFFIPYPQFNEHPRKGTGYYLDAFEGNVEYQKEEEHKNFFEYGLRWRKTFGKSDFSVMTASLIDNEYALRMVSPGLIAKSKQRFFMAGMTFNRAISNLLFRGEIAIKSRKPYNDASLQIVKKNALDASLAVDYSLSNTFTLSMEGVNYHVVDWTDDIQGVPRNNYMLLFVMSKQLMKNDLSLSWVTMYNGSYTSFFNLLTASYNWNDHITLSCNALIPITDDVNSGYYPYRDQKQVGFRVLYQF